MINELGIVIMNYAKIIPAGLVVFFPSFLYMNQVVQVWKSNDILKNVECSKKVIIYIMQLLIIITQDIF